MKKYGLIILGVFCTLLVGVAWASTAQNGSLVRQVIGGGGDRLEQGNVSLDNSLGQPVVGNYGGGGVTLCVGFWCRSALEAQMPTANFTAYPRQGESPLTVTFTDTSTCTPTQWLWLFGDGETLTVQHPKHTYERAGAYTVTLMVTNTYGNDRLAQNHYITVTEPPCISLAGATTRGPATGEIATDYVFTATTGPISVTTPITYVWQTGPSASRQTITHTGGLSDTVVLSWTVTGAQPITTTVINCGNAVTANHTISITHPSTCTQLTGVDLSTMGTLQAGTAVMFFADVTPDDATTPYSYTIEYGDESAPLTSTGSADPLTLTHTYSATGSFTVEIGIWNCNMTTPVTDTLEIEVLQGAEFYAYLPLAIKDLDAGGAFDR